MITFSPDFTRLIGFDDAGNPFSHAYTEGAPYMAMVKTRSQQQQADLDNIKVAQQYRVLLDAAQSLAASGHTDYTVPVKPLQRVITDTGRVLSAPFSDLPDFVLPPPVVVRPPAPPANSPWGNLSGGSTVDVNARDARQFEMVSDIWAWIQTHK